MTIILKDLPKISLNKWYAGKHWSERKRIKDIYYYAVKSQFNGVFSKEHEYETEYTFNFKSRPLDASNCVAAIKLLEDILFEDDKWNIVRKITIISNKGKIDNVTIKIIQL